MKYSFTLSCLLVLLIGCSSANKELFEKTDEFVQSLDTEYESYGLLGGLEHATTTSDGQFKITPTGRLINVKIMKVVPDEEYEELRQDLEEHYENDKRVNKVYVNRGGTIIIDCRN